MKGTLKDMGNQLAQSFQELSPAQQEQTRKAMYESVTGKPYRERKPRGCIAIVTVILGNGSQRGSLSLLYSCCSDFLRDWACLPRCSCGMYRKNPNREQ